MIESELWEKAKKGFERAAPGIHLTRIENTATSGMPDVDVCFKGRHAPVELKIIRKNRMKFRASQISWIKRRLRANGKVFVLAQDLDQVIYLIDGAVVNELTNWRAFVLHTFIEPFDWKNLLVTILTFE